MQIIHKMYRAFTDIFNILTSLSLSNLQWRFSPMLRSTSPIFRFRIHIWRQADEKQSVPSGPALAPHHREKKAR